MDEFQLLQHAFGEMIFSDDNVDFHEDDNIDPDSNRDQSGSDAESSSDGNEDKSTNDLKDFQNEDDKEGLYLWVSEGLCDENYLHLDLEDGVRFNFHLRSKKGKLILEDIQADIIYQREPFPPSFIAEVIESKLEISSPSSPAHSDELNPSGWTFLQWCMQCQLSPEILRLFLPQLSADHYAEMLIHLSTMRTQITSPKQPSALPCFDCIFKKIDRICFWLYPKKITSSAPVSIAACSSSTVVLSDLSGSEGDFLTCINGCHSDFPALVPYGHDSKFCPFCQKSLTKDLLGLQCNPCSSSFGDLLVACPFCLYRACSTKACFLIRVRGVSEILFKGSICGKRFNDYTNPTPICPRCNGSYYLDRSNGLTYCCSQCSRDFGQLKHCPSCEPMTYLTKNQVDASIYFCDSKCKRFFTESLEFIPVCRSCPSIPLTKKSADYYVCLTCSQLYASTIASQQMSTFPASSSSTMTLSAIEIGEPIPNELQPHNYWNFCIKCSDFCSFVRAGFPPTTMTQFCCQKCKTVGRPSCPLCKIPNYMNPTVNSCNFQCPNCAKQFDQYFNLISCPFCRSISESIGNFKKCSSTACGRHFFSRYCPKCKNQPLTWTIAGICQCMSCNSIRYYTPALCPADNCKKALSVDGSIVNCPAGCKLNFCRNCRTGILRPIDLKENPPNWICSSCFQRYDSSLIRMPICSICTDNTTFLTKKAGHFQCKTCLTTFGKTALPCPICVFTKKQFILLKCTSWDSKALECPSCNTIFGEFLRPCPFCLSESSHRKAPPFIVLDIDGKFTCSRCRQPFFTLKEYIKRMTKVFEEFNAQRIKTEYQGRILAQCQSIRLTKKLESTKIDLHNERARYQTVENQNRMAQVEMQQKAYHDMVTKLSLAKLMSSINEATEFSELLQGHQETTSTLLSQIAAEEHKIRALRTQFEEDFKKMKEIEPHLIHPEEIEEFVISLAKFEESLKPEIDPDQDPQTELREEMLIPQGNVGELTRLVIRTLSSSGPQWIDLPQLGSVIRSQGGLQHFGFPSGVKLKRVLKANLSDVLEFRAIPPSSIEIRLRQDQYHGSSSHPQLSSILSEMAQRHYPQANVAFQDGVTSNSPFLRDLLSFGPKSLSFGVKTFLDTTETLLTTLNVFKETTRDYGQLVESRLAYQHETLARIEALPIKDLNTEEYKESFEELQVESVQAISDANSRLQSLSECCEAVFAMFLSVRDHAKRLDDENTVNSLQNSRFRSEIGLMKKKLLPRSIEILTKRVALFQAKMSAAEATIAEMKPLFQPTHHLIVESLQTLERYEKLTSENTALLEKHRKMLS